MKIQAICRADARALPGKTSKTGIFKHAVNGPVMVDVQGIVGDAVCNRKHHGGPDQAIYAMGSGDLDFWAQDRGHPIEPGFFGENLVIEGMDSAALCVGDRLELQQVTLEVTAARIPCATLTARVGDPHFAKRFRDAGHPGAYCRVLKTGMIEAGESVTLIPYAGTKLPIPVILKRFRPNRLTQDERAAFLGTPLAIRFREMIA